MPFTLNEANHCAISGKPIRTGDYVVAFPAYESYPGEPEYVCSENIALRYEFEIWQFKEQVVNKVRNAWLNWYRNSETFSVLWEVDSFLVVKSLLENKIRLFFLRHVLALEVNNEKWRELRKNMLTREDVQMTLDSSTSLFWKVSPLSVNLLIVDKEWEDSINIPSVDWEQLLQFFSSETSSL